MHRPTLHLRRERLSELTPADLDAVGGGIASLPSCAATVRTCTCGATNTCACGATHTCACVDTAMNCLTAIFAGPGDDDTTLVLYVGLC